MTDIPLRELKLLKQKSRRDETGQFMAEGEKFINEIPGGFIDGYLISSGYNARNPDFAAKAGAPVKILKDSVLKSLSSLKSPPGRIALCRKARYSLDGVLGAAGSQNGLLILAEELNDPGNLGTIIRTAYAAGASGVVTSKGSADAFGPKALQSAAGSVFHVPVIENVGFAEFLPRLRENGIRVLAASADNGAGNTSHYGSDLTKPLAFLLGSEARGISSETARLADASVSIPMPGGAESLNVAVSCAVLIFEALRQRRILYEKSNRSI